jgi:hypothetical protein
VSCCQRLGYVNQDAYQHTDWDAVAKNPDAIKAKYGKWIWSHDAEQYAAENFGALRKHLEEQREDEWENTNLPPGFKYAPWTIGELEEANREGRTIVLEGRWS